MSRSRSQEVTVVEPPRFLAFAGPMGTSAAALGNGIRAGGRRQTDHHECGLRSTSRHHARDPRPTSPKQNSGVSDIEMVAIKVPWSAAREARRPRWGGAVYRDACQLQEHT